VTQPGGGRCRRSPVPFARQGRPAETLGRPAPGAPRTAHGSQPRSAGCSKCREAWRRSPMTDDVLNRPPVHALLADGTTVCIRPAAPGDHDQLEGLYEEMSPENLRLRFFAASRRSAAVAADRACAPARSGYRALLAETQGRVIGLAEYDTGDDKDAVEISTGPVRPRRYGHRSTRGPRGPARPAHRPRRARPDHVPALRPAAVRRAGQRPCRPRKPWNDCCCGCPGWPRICRSSPRPTSTRSSRLRGRSPCSTHASACCRAGPTTPICADSAEEDQP
jgi:hypothetical protein